MGKVGAPCGGADTRHPCLESAENDIVSFSPLGLVTTFSKNHHISCAIVPQRQVGAQPLGVEPIRWHLYVLKHGFDLEDVVFGTRVYIFTSVSSFTVRETYILKLVSTYLRLIELKLLERRRQQGKQEKNYVS